MLSDTLPQSPYAEPKQKPASSGQKRWFQFSLKALLIFTGLVALGLGMLASQFIAVVVVTTTTVSMIGATIATIVYGRGWIQGFAIGFAPILLMGILFAFDTPGVEALVFCWFLTILFGMISGLTAACVKGFLKRRNGSIGLPNIPLIRNWLEN